MFFRDPKKEEQKFRERLATTVLGGLGLTALLASVMSRGPTVNTKNRLSILTEIQRPITPPAIRPTNLPPTQQGPTGLPPTGGGSPSGFLPSSNAPSVNIPIVTPRPRGNFGQLPPTSP